MWGRHVSSMTSDSEELDDLFSIECSVCNDYNDFSKILFSDEHTKSFKIIHQNIRSYCKNFDELLVILDSFKCVVSCIVLSETWLCDEDEVVQIQGYNSFRTFNQLNQNDGLVVYIDSTIDVVCEQILLGGVANCLSLTFSRADCRYNILAVYRSPSSDLSQFVSALTDYYNAICDQDLKQILVGDTNCNILNIKQGTENERYFDNLYELHFHSCIDKITRPDSNSCIDHCFVKNVNISLVKSAVMTSAITDHYLVGVSIIEHFNTHVQGRTVDFVKVINWKQLRDSLRNHNWQELLQLNNVDLSAEMLTNTIKELISNATFEKPVNAKFTKLKPWITAGLVRSIRERDRLSKKLKSQPFNAFLRNRYIQYRNLLNTLIRRTKYDYYKAKIEEAGSNAKKFWSLLNEVAGRPGHRPKFPLGQFIQNVDVATTEQVKTVCNTFNDCFASVGSVLADQIQPNAPIVVDDADHAVDAVFTLQPVTREQLIMIVSSLRGGSSPGWDGISTKFVKENINELIEPIMHITNQSIRSGRFPNIYKIAKVIPIYKSGLKSSISNFRPISLLSVFSKIIEKSVKIQLTNYLESLSLIASNQYGFKTDKSTSDALFSMISLVHEEIAKGNRVLVIFLDLAKAFDTVHREKLLKKMEYAGFSDATLNWFVSYFDARSQVVSISNVDSEMKNVDFGVVQGSTLGPLLFLLYINNITKLRIEGGLFLFADDTAVVSVGRTWDEAFARASLDLLKLKSWFDQNVLTVNIAKTKCLPVYFRKDSGPERQVLRMHSCGDHRAVACGCEEIEKVKEYKYLGILISHNLSWSSHILHIKQRLRKLLYAFSQLGRVLSVDHCRSAYYSYAQSILQYGILVWGGVSTAVLEPLAVTQRALIKTILKKPVRYPTEELFLEFRVYNVRQLYIKTLVLFIRNNKNPIFQNLEHHYSTRYKERIGITIPKITLTVGSTNPYYLAHIVYRNLPPDLKQTENVTLVKFKKILSAWLSSIGKEACENLVHSVYT
jgi:hypothetical protein